LVTKLDNIVIARFNIVTLMVLFSVLSYFDRTIMAVAGPGIMRNFGLSETQMGTVYSAFLLGYALMMIPAGYLADRLGAWRTLIGMGFGAALFTGLTALGTRPGLGSLIGIVPALVLIRFLMGVCTAPLYPSCGRMNANWFPVTRQALVWGLIAGGAGIGSALSPSLFSWTIPHYGWRKSFCLAGAATGLVTIVWAWYARDHPSEHRSLRNNQNSLFQLPAQAADPVAQAAIRALIVNRNVALLTAGYLAIGYFEYIFFFWIYYYFGEIRHMSRTQTSIYTTLIFLSWAVMTPIGGWFSDQLVARLGKKIGRPIVPVGGMLLGALLLFLGMHQSRPGAVGALLALSFGLASSSDGPFWAATIDAGGENVGGACGILNTGSNIGGFIAPVLTPFIASLAGWSWALYFGCLVAALGAFLWLFLDVKPSGCFQAA
jgi:MFS family permease